MKTLSQPLKWHGGKHYLAEWIVSHFPPHLHYVEPFFGGGAVLFARDPERDWLAGHPDCETGGNGRPQAKHRGASEAVNDVHGELMTFWRVLQDPDRFALLRRRLEATPLAEEEWRASFDPATDDVERAARLFVRIRQSRQALGKDFATLSRLRTRRGMNELSSAWLSAIDGLADVHARLAGVVILNRDALEVIRSQDGPLTLFYCDPPYVHESRTARDCYQHEMSGEDHRRLLAALRDVRGKAILSGYRNPLYDRMLADWRTAERTIDNKSGGGQAKQQRTEVLWMNF